MRSHLVSNIISYQTARMGPSWSYQSFRCCLTSIYKVVYVFRDSKSDIASWKQLFFDLLKAALKWSNLFSLPCGTAILIIPAVLSISPKTDRCFATVHMELKCRRTPSYDTKDRSQRTTVQVVQNHSAICCERRTYLVLVDGRSLLLQDRPRACARQNVVCPFSLKSRQAQFGSALIYRLQVLIKCLRFLLSSISAIEGSLVERRFDQIV